MGLRNADHAVRYRFASKSTSIHPISFIYIYPRLYCLTKHLPRPVSVSRIPSATTRSQIFFHCSTAYSLYSVALSVRNATLQMCTKTYARYEQITYVSSPPQWLADHKSCPLGLAQDQKSIFHNLISVVCFGNDLVSVLFQTCCPRVVGLRTKDVRTYFGTRVDCEKLGANCGRKMGGDGMSSNLRTQSI